MNVTQDAEVLRTCASNVRIVENDGNFALGALLAACGFAKATVE